MTPKKISIEDAHVVVVDDDQESRKITLDYLEGMGFRHIDIASEGAEGLARIAEDTRLLIANIHMPRLSGIELLKAVREAQNFKRKTTLIITSSRKNLKLIFKPRDSNRPFGVICMIQNQAKTKENGLDWDDSDNTGEWDSSGEWSVDNHWQEPEGDERSETSIHISDTLSVVMAEEVLRQDDLEKILTFGGAEFIRKPLNEAEFRFAVQKALLAASVDEGVRVKYESWAKSLQISGKELIREFGMEKKSSTEGPFQDRHPNPIAEFSAEQHENEDVQPFLNANPNWTTDRTAANLSARWKIVFASLIRANFDYCRGLYAQEKAIEDVEGIKGKILVCDLGLGSGRTLRGLRQKGIPEDSLVAVANIRLFELQSMLDAALLPDVKQEDDSALSQFLRYFSIEFLNQKGMGGLLDIQFGKPEHEARLRKLLQEVDVNRICGSKTLLLPGMFTKEREEEISEEVLQLFEEYRQDPRTFFQKYFQPALTDSGKGDLKSFVETRIHGKHLLPLDFRDIGDNLSGAQILGPTYDCRALSHLPDPGYHNTMLSILARLTPGAIYIGDGAIQSYSGHIRGGELMEILRLFEKKGNLGEYRAWWLGDDDGPLSVVVQRGIKDEQTGEYRFWDVEGDGQYNFGTYLRGAEMIPLDQFYKKWPRLALKNLVIRELRKRFWDEAMKDMMSRNETIEYVRTWLSDKMRLSPEEAEHLEGWDRPIEQGVRVFDYLDVFLQSTFEGEEFQKHVAEDGATDLEEWMKRKMNGKQSGWIMKLADRFMTLRDVIIAAAVMKKQKQENGQGATAPEEEVVMATEGEPDTEEDPEAGAASAMS
ncbi:response regulator [Candidatus Peregrinibacteria bacterium]|nr:response regulator [Candidatus Peregrinibacteria bacterium]